jgi:putative ABC transport system ATP-binding protein
MGPSGCGKSTLLHVLGMVTPPDGGELIFAGRTVDRSDSARSALRRERIGIVFQRLNLLSVLSARDNIEISLHVRGVRRNGQVDRLLTAMGVAHLAGRKPEQMSIGEQQRVAVARAMAHEPDVLLADEPTGSLDSRNSNALMDLLRTVNQRDGQTIVLITHSPAVAERADRVVYMHDGRLVDQPAE